MDSDILVNVGQRLELENGGRWKDQHLELQDEQRSILVSVSVSDEMPQREVETVRADIRGVLKAEVPPRSEDYAWTAVIKKRGVVVDSLMGGCTSGLPEI